MLTAEQAKAQLAALADPGWRSVAAGRIDRLPEPQRPWAAVLLEPEPGYDQPAARCEFPGRLDEAAAGIDGLPAADRVALMAALHPALGAVLAQWWVAAQGQPYGSGDDGLFRAPHTPQTSRGARTAAVRAVLVFAGPYDRGATWLAEWASHLQHDRHWSVPFPDQHAGPLLAAAIDTGGEAGDEVLATLRQIAAGEHPVGAMGQHVLVGLLRCGRPEAWEFLGRLLLAAARQEGLRQAVLERAGQAHPGAFDHLLDLVLEHDLLRFAAAVRAAGGWLGVTADAQQAAAITRRVGQLRRLRADPDACAAALAGGDGWQTHLALRVRACRDVVAAVADADAVLARPDPDARAVAVRFLGAIRLRSARPGLVRALDDPDLPVAALAHAVHRGTYPWGSDPGLFERLERLARRLPERPTTSAPVGMEAGGVPLSRAAVVGSLLSTLDRRPLSALLPWFPSMDLDTRRRLAAAIGAARQLTPELREVLLRMLGDRSPLVRERAVGAITQLGLTAADAPEIEALLTRRAGDLRRAMITLLARQPTVDAVRSAQRLWSTGTEPQRDAACELLAVLAGPPDVAAAARAFAAGGPTERQRGLLTGLLAADAAAGTEAESPGTGPEPDAGPEPGAADRPDLSPPARWAEPGAGYIPPGDPYRALLEPARRALYDPTGRAAVPAPVAVRPPGSLGSATAIRVACALDELVAGHRDTVVRVPTLQGPQDVLLGDAIQLPSPFGPWAAQRRAGAADPAETGLVLADVFLGWWRDRPIELRGDDALDPLRALVAGDVGHRVEADDPQREWYERLTALVGVPSTPLRHARVVGHVLSWLLADGLGTAVVDECLDGLETALAAVPADWLARTQPDDPTVTVWEWRYAAQSNPWARWLDMLFRARADLFDAARIGRWFRLMRWLDEPRSGVSRHRVDAQLLLAAHSAGAATDDDLLDALLDPHGRLLREITRRRREALVRRHPAATAIVDRLRDQVLTAELGRGELPTWASLLALRLGSIGGASRTFALLGRLGRGCLQRGRAWSGWPSGGWQDESLGREVVVSHLIRVSHPAVDDTAQTVRAAAAAERVPDGRLVELAVFAPQWAALVEGALDWPGLADAVWWFHAHTKDQQWTVPEEVRETWAALSAERTPLTAADLLAGAVDVAWFWRCHRTLGPARWATVHAAAKLAASGTGHRRAQLFAEAMRGEVAEGTLVARITERRQQDPVRALGLLPLPDDPAERAATTQRRYAVIREFERGAAKFGAQRQDSERTAGRIAVENLARTAGATDPQRFVWAMEAAEAGDLAAGPVDATAGGVTVTLSVDAEGEPELAVRRAGRTLQSVPGAARKAPAIAALAQRKTALGRQAARVRLALEAAMVDQDPFTAGDLAALDGHPVVAPMLRRLVFVDEAGRTVRRGDGAELLDARGGPATRQGLLRLAHPLDLLAAGSWVAWQEWFVAGELRQPFRQVFRELYPPTDGERAAGTLCTRYAGYQLQRGQALALFGHRGWLTDRETGIAARTFHRHRLVARVEFGLDAVGGTPAEVELPALGDTTFTRREEYWPEPLESVPALVFSETMRDLDLVVSVAHAGGVDPEASASTVEMRAALVRETARLLRLDNVHLLDSHAAVTGQLGEYTVHLGSGIVHRRPGQSVCIVPVDSQRRGRIFLPFADDDPRTAEILAKVLLLARDDQITDPTILTQLR